MSREIKLVWANAFMFCRSFGMELVSLPTKDLADKFTQLCFENAPYFDKYTYIGGTYIGAGLNNFYWLSTGKPVSYELIFSPGEPSNYGGRQKCLAVQKQNGPFKFDDIEGFGTLEEKFVCESIPQINEIDSETTEIVLI